MKQSKVLVTGGAGFIGSHLVERLLKDGHEVSVIDSLKRGNKIPKEVLSNIRLEVCDVRERKKVFEVSKNCNIIYHLAAVLGVDIVADNPVETMEVEIEGTNNIMYAAQEFGIDKIVYASTSGVYGKLNIEKAVVEDAFLSPASSYSIAKRYNEIYLKSFYQEKQINSVSVRLFNVYGPRQDNRMVIPRFIEQAISEKDITIYGSGNQTRDFTFIDDVIESIILLSDNMKGSKIVNIARGTEVSILKLAEMVLKISGSKSKILKIESPSERYDFDVDKRVGDASKLFELTGYKPLTSFEDGLGLCYQYFAERMSQKLK
ncbi:MAG: NAD-dependent epimerase/dehydratase family protein [Melioribacteraceae bacterium]|nr:NAD-dependent epimerase/dehydratase family protein [Melioribacteraceae bacterium]